MAPILAYYHKNLLSQKTEADTPLLIEIIQVPTSGKAQAVHWHVVQKPLSYFASSSSTNFSRFQISYCLLALGITIGFNIFFILKDLDLKILDGIVVPLLFLYILAVQMTISKCRQRQSQVLEV